MLGTDAIRLLHIRALCSDGRIWMDGFQVLAGESGGVGRDVRSIGCAVPAYREDCFGADYVEHHRCRRGCSAYRIIYERKERKHK